MRKGGDYQALLKKYPPMDSGCNGGQVPSQHSLTTANQFEYFFNGMQKSDVVVIHSKKPKRYSFGIIQGSVEWQKAGELELRQELRGADKKNQPSIFSPEMLIAIRRVEWVLKDRPPEDLALAYGPEGWHNIAHYQAINPIKDSAWHSWLADLVSQSQQVEAIADDSDDSDDDVPINTLRKDAADSSEMNATFLAIDVDDVEPLRANPWECTNVEVRTGWGREQLKAMGQSQQVGAIAEGDEDSDDVPINTLRKDVARGSAGTTPRAPQAAARLSVATSVLWAGEETRIPKWLTHKLHNDNMQWEAEPDLAEGAYLHACLCLCVCINN